MQLESTLTCPRCSFQATETMPTDACQFFYVCKGCGENSNPSRAIVVCSVPTAPCLARPSSRAARARVAASRCETVSAAWRSSLRRQQGTGTIGGEHCELRPKPLPARCLCHVIGGRKICPGIGTNDHVGDIVKPLRRIDVVTGLRAADSDLGCCRQEAVDAVGRTMQRRVR